MSERLYNIILTGRIRPGFTHEDVVQGLVRITKRPSETIERLLLQHEPTVARNVPRGDVRVYIAKIAKTGAVAEAREMFGAGGIPLPQLHETASLPPPPPPQEHVLSLVPDEPLAPETVQPEQRPSVRIRSAAERRAALAALAGGDPDFDDDDDGESESTTRKSKPATDSPWSGYFAGLLSPGRRISRLGFLYRTLIFTLAMLPLHLLALFMQGSNEQALAEAVRADAIVDASTTTVNTGALLGTLGLATLLIVLILFILFIPAIQRLHDQSRSGWWALTMLVPLLNFVLLYFLLGIEGDDGPNEYGPPPPPNPPLLENPVVIAVCVLLILGINLG